MPELTSIPGGGAIDGIDKQISDLRSDPKPWNDQKSEKLLELYQQKVAAEKGPSPVAAAAEQGDNDEAPQENEGEQTGENDGELFDDTDPEAFAATRQTRDFISNRWGGKAPETAAGVQSLLLDFFGDVSTWRRTLRETGLNRDAGAQIEICRTWANWQICRCLKLR